MTREDLKRLAVLDGLDGRRLIDRSDVQLQIDFILMNRRGVGAGCRGVGGVEVVGGAVSRGGHVEGRCGRRWDRSAFLDFIN